MNTSADRARVIVDELIRGGVQEAVLCPGARTSALALAFRSAETAGLVRLHLRFDERACGFLGIGLAVAEARPVPILTTPALAGLAPAILEADYAAIPLVVLTTGPAPSPEEPLHRRVRACVRLARTDAEQFAVDGHETGGRHHSVWRSDICRALAAAHGEALGRPGPVWVDVPAPDALTGPAPDCSYPADRPGGRPWTTSRRATVEIPVRIDLSHDTVLISGHGADPQPELAGLPAVTEPTSPPQGPALHPLALPFLRPRQAIVVGRPTLHRQVSELLRDPSVTVYSLTPSPLWPDVPGTVTAAGTRAAPLGTPHPDWLWRCGELGRRAHRAVRAELKRHSHPTGLHVAATVMDALRVGDRLLLGASNPVRDAALVWSPRTGIEVLSNRGVAGIDGTVSTAVGAALTHGGRTIALIGDLTFLHDVCGLLIGRTEPRPDDLTIVVANDNGGGIFELLEQGDPAYAGISERIFATPHGADLEALCAAYRIAHRRVTTAELAVALRGRAGGLRVLEVATERSSRRDLHMAIRTAILRNEPIAAAHAAAPTASAP
ncbi:thiamine pyrophosphate-binding protein [Nocardia sp. NPDC003963]